MIDVRRIAWALLLGGLVLACKKDVPTQEEGGDKAAPEPVAVEQPKAEDEAEAPAPDEADEEDEAAEAPEPEPEPVAAPEPKPKPAPAPKPKLMSVKAQPPAAAALAARPVTPKPVRAGDARPTIKIVHSCNLQGEVEPCG